MTMVKRDRIRSALDKTGKFTTTIKGVVLTIEKRAGEYEISVHEPGEKPSEWIYRSERIALDRFDEQCANYRRQP